MEPVTSREVAFYDVQDAFDSAMLLPDRNLIRLVTAVVVANQLPGAPVWLMIVAPPSGGKTAILTCLDDLEFLPGKKVSFFISDLTENTLASGFKGGGGEASLLNQVPYGGMLIFKDFTSLLTKRHEARDAIMGQLREVYDRKFDKKTGNNQDVAWKGKLGSLAGVTTAVHEYMVNMAVMGDRYTMYTPAQPDRMELLKFIMAMKLDGDSQEKKMASAKDLLHKYLRRCVTRLKTAKLAMSEANQNHLMEVADFATKVRSGVIVDERRNLVQFVPDVEMPTRLIEQLLSIATVLSHMHEIDKERPDLTKNDMNILYKIAFDSIPIKRRWALRALAEHPIGITTAGLAAKVGYETEVAKEWLAQLAALGICTRHPNGRGGADIWQLNQEYREVMYTFDGVEKMEGVLVDPRLMQDEMLAEEALRDFGDLSNEFPD